MNDSTANAPLLLRLCRAFTPLDLHPAAMASFVLRPAVQMRSICAWEILISPRFFVGVFIFFVKERSSRGRARACLCLLLVHAAAGTLDGKLSTGISRQQKHSKRPERSDSSQIVLMNVLIKGCPSQVSPHWKVMIEC